MTTPSILVVGGSGFIGHHVVRNAADKGWEVTSLGLHPPAPMRMVLGTRYLNFDVTRRSAFASLGELSFDYVVNLGGYIDHTLLNSGGGTTIRAHFDALVSLIESIDRRRLKSFVQIGSSDEYGDGMAPQQEGQRERPISPYSVAKVAATHLIQMLYRSEGFPGVILRPFLTYGPGQDQRRFLPQVIRGCIDGSKFPVSDGAQLRDFCYVDDIVQAVFRSLDCKEAHGRVFNVASGQARTIRSVIETIVRLVGAGTPQFGAVAYRPGESMALYADVAMARQVLDWQASTPFEQGLAATIAWMKSCPP